MTQPTTNRGWTYPTEWLDPWYDELFDLFEEIDQDVQDLFNNQTGRQSKKALSYVDCTADPTSWETDGNRLVLDFSGAPHANYDGASQGDIVDYVLATDTWDSITPEDGWVIFVNDVDDDMHYTDNPSAAWERRYIGIFVRGSGTYSARLGDAGGDSSGDYSFATGKSSDSRWFSSFALAGETYGSNPGQSQGLMAVLNGVTINDTPTELFPDGSAGSEYLTLEDNRGGYYTAKVFAYREDDPTEAKCWDLQFMITNPSGVPVLVGGVVKNPVRSTATGTENAWDIDADVQVAPSNRIRFMSTGSSGEKIAWQILLFGPEVCITDVP